MQVLIIGAAGMVGSKLAAALATAPDAGVGRTDSGRRSAAHGAGSCAGAGRGRHAGAHRRGGGGDAIAARPDVIYHLAAIVSGEAEADFEKGYAVNFDGTRYLLDAIRAQQNYYPRVIFASSIAVFGTPFPETIPDDFHLTPLTSYGTQKAMGELMLNDYSRRGFLDGIGIRLPTICIRPGLPNKAASGFFSNILREPLVGKEAVLPVDEDGAALAREPARGDRLLPPRADARHRAARAAAVPDDAGRLGDGRGGNRGVAPGGGRPGGGADPPRARPGDPEDRRGLGDAVRRERGRSRWASRRTPPSTRSSRRMSTTNSAGGSDRAKARRRLCF